MLPTPPVPSTLQVEISGSTINDLNCELKKINKLGYMVKSGGINGMYELLNEKSRGKYGGAFWACKANGTDCNYVLKI